MHNFIKDSKHYKHVAVIMGGDSSEREISLMSGTAVFNALHTMGINVVSFDPKEKSLLELVKMQIDCAVIMLHGKNGEDGIVQGFLESVKIPYTGSGVLASSLAMDKYRTKMLWHSIGIPVPKFQYVTLNTFNNHSFVLTLDLPVIVKPASGGSTIGLTKVFNIEDIDFALNKAFENDQCVLIEELIIGDEFTATVFNDKVLPFIKIEAPQDNYDYQNKYFDNATKYLCSYNLGSYQDIVLEYVLQAYGILGSKGVARIDFMLNKEKKPFFLELNTIPGMTSHSLVPMAFNSVGINFDELCKILLNDASLNR